MTEKTKMRCCDCDRLIDYTFRENGPVILQGRHFCSTTCFIDYEHEKYPVKED